MPTDLPTLLRRDHSDLQNELTQLLDPTASVTQLRSSLDGVRLGLTAHAEAEDIVLARYESVPALQMAIAQVQAAHLAQEHALSALVCSRPGTISWRNQAAHLRELVRYHALQEEATLLPALQLHLTEYPRLAGAFATQRLRQLAMLQPSAQYVMSALAG